VHQRRDCPLGVVQTEIRIRRLTDDIPLHQVETVQLADRLGRVVWALIHHVRRALRLERRVVAEPDLADGTVPSEQVVQVVPRDVEIATPLGDFTWTRREHAYRFFTLRVSCETTVEHGS